MNRYMLRLAVFGAFLTQVPLVSAHGESSSPFLTEGSAIVIALSGVLLTGLAVVGKRSERISPRSALYTALFGVSVATLGVILFEGVTPDPAYTASSMPFPRSWYVPLSLGVGLSVTVFSFVAGWLRWPTRPRYTFLGMFVGLWIAYPSLIPGAASDTHPIGYALVVSLPVLIGYIVWTDARDAIAAALRDTVARRFAVGITVVTALFFVSASNYLSFFPDEDVPPETVVDFLSVVYPLVTWQTLEVYLPDVPVFAAMSIGVAILVGTVSLLVGLNALLIGFQWRSWGVAEGATVQGTAGPTAVIGACACGCCGPLVAKVAILAAGPSVAAPLYWLFVDPSSPFASAFLVGGIVLFTGSLVYATNAVQADRDTQPTVSGESDPA